jgi:two-component system nitrate/nitrite sensor histidine kinase NarX
MLRQIRTQLLIIIISFTLLVLGSFSISYLYIQDHTSDEIAMEIIREQRIILQRLTWLALIDPDDPSIPLHKENLERNIKSISENGLFLPLDGEPPKIHFQADSLIRSEYALVAQLWPQYEDRLEIVLSIPQNNLTRTQSWLELQSLTREIVENIDSASIEYENHINNQHSRLRFLQIGFIAITIPLVVAGVYLIGSRIVRPLNSLNQSANQIRDGKLNQSIRAEREDEIGQLAHSMEAMRVEISASQYSLEARIAERTHELTVVARFSQDIARQIEVEQIIKSVTNQAKDLLNAKDVSLCLVSPDGQYLKMVSHNSDLILSDRPEQPIFNEPVFSSQDQTDQTKTLEISDSTCEFLKSDRSDLCLSSSLRVGNNLIGALCVIRDRKKPFNVDERNAFSLLANSAAIAIFNSYLIEKDKQRVREAAISTERQRLASDLHDELAQNLGVSQLQVNQILSSLPDHDPSEITKMLEVLQANLRVAHEQVRMVISGLATRPNVNTLCLQTDIKNCIADFNKLCDIPVKLQVIGIPWEDASPIVQRQLLLILREALVNIRRHAHASRVDIAVAKNADLLVLQIRDNGRGFNPDKAMGDQHFGLEIMHARADRSGGKMEIISSPGAGTEIKASFPLNKPGSKTIEIGEMVRE